MPAELAVLPATAGDVPCAAELAKRLALPLLAASSHPLNCAEAGTVLLVSGQQRCLQQTGKGAPGPVAVDFGGAQMRHRRRSGGRELLGKAVGLDKKQPLKVLDATAGLGRDAFVLADLGCDILLCERQPVIAEMLRAGLQIAAESADNSLVDSVRRMTLFTGDARQVASLQLREVEVIYLDPMFPQRDKSAAVKKEMALFQRLLEHQIDESEDEALLHWSLQQDVARVVVKRPLKAPCLAATSPSHDIRGKAVRYDVYVRRKLR